MQICLSCQKSISRGWRRQEAIEGVELTCPECHGPITVVGEAFKLPRTNDHKGWRKVKVMLAKGVSFYEDELWYAFRRRGKVKTIREAKDLKPRKEPLPSEAMFTRSSLTDGSKAGRGWPNPCA